MGKREIMKRQKSVGRKHWKTKHDNDDDINNNSSSRGNSTEAKYESWTRMRWTTPIERMHSMVKWNVLRLLKPFDEPEVKRWFRFRLYMLKCCTKWHHKHVHAANKTEIVFFFSLLHCECLILAVNRFIYQHLIKQYGFNGTNNDTLHSMCVPPMLCYYLWNANLLNSYQLNDIFFWRNFVRIV